MNNAAAFINISLSMFGSAVGIAVFILTLMSIVSLIRHRTIPSVRSILIIIGLLIIAVLSTYYCASNIFY